MRHRLSSISTYGLNGQGKGNIWAPAYALLEYYGIFTQCFRMSLSLSAPNLVNIVLHEYVTKIIITMQLLDFSFKMHQIQFLLGLRPRPRWGAHSVDPVVGFKWGNERDGKGRKGGKKGKGGEGEEREGGQETRTPSHKSCLRQWRLAIVFSPFLASSVQRGAENGRTCIDSYSQILTHARQSPHTT